MKTLLRTFLAVVLTAGAATIPAFAQDQPVIGTLHVDGGTVMTSTGDEFSSATESQPLKAGDRIMVSEGGSASVNYSDCMVVNYTTPGVYVVKRPVKCAGGQTNEAAGGSGTTGTAGSVGIILGAALLGAAGVNAMGDDTPPDHPVSR